VSTINSDILGRAVACAVTELIGPRGLLFLVNLGGGDYLGFCSEKRKVLRNFFASVEGGLSGGSSMHRPGSEDPHRH
jgi:hypothetical protein